jgi:hypothetical protein
MISNATMAGLKTAESEFYVQFPNGREYMLICLLRFPNILLAAPFAPLQITITSGSGSLCCGAIADEQKRDIVGLTGAARKLFNGIEDRLLETIQRRVVPARKGFT